MRKSIFAICDLEASYAYNLMESICKRQGTSFEVQAFTSVNSLLAFAREQYIELLLISAAAMCDTLLKLSIGRIMILSEGKMMKEISDYPCIYKYQASDQIIAEVMNYYAVEQTPAPMAVMKKNMEIVGIYSPVGRSSKTSFAITYGQLMARDRKTLYLNMEEYAGFEILMEEEYQADLADLLYFARLGSGNLVYRLGSLIHRLGNLDYIPPAFCPEDLRSIRPPEWGQLVRDLAEYSAYDVIILDIGPAVCGVLDILRLCTRIFMPVREDCVSAAKINQYEKNLKQQNALEVLDKTRKLKLPFRGSLGTGKSHAEQLIWGELGDYVRRIVREETDERLGNGRIEAEEEAAGTSGAVKGRDGSGDLSPN